MALLEHIERHQSVAVACAHVKSILKTSEVINEDFVNLVAKEIGFYVLAQVAQGRGDHLVVDHNWGNPKQVVFVPGFLQDMLYKYQHERG